jgi:hypothetical protein
MKQPEDTRTLELPLTSTLVERVRMAEADIIRLTHEIDYHRAAATKLRYQREWAKQRLARALSAIRRSQQ